MTVFFIHPNLTVAKNKNLDTFFSVCRDEIEQHISTQIISNEEVMSGIDLSKEDVVIFFNNSNNQEYEKYIVDFLQEACSKETLIFPVALDKDNRNPPVVIAELQSFDISENLRKRSLTQEQIGTISLLFARGIIARSQPTLSRDNMNIFLSHRRLDGEEITGKFFDFLNSIEQKSFRDINKVLMGEDAQEIIEKNLKQSDVVIFLDTPKSGESKWIAKELRMAMTHGIPIIWVKIGEETNRSKEYYFPVAHEPHFYLPTLNPKTDSISNELSEKIVHEAFKMIRKNSINIMGYIKRIRELSNNKEIVLKSLDQKHLTYQIEIPRKGYRYFQKPMTHIVSFYGRIPQGGDQNEFMSNIKKIGYEPHPKWGHWYDSTIMLAPVFSENNETIIEDPDRIDSCEEYINSLESYLSHLKNPQKKRGQGIIISGAFPITDGDEQHYVIDAVRAFTQTIFSRNHQIIFGAHPTFQPLIFDMADQLNFKNEPMTHMYISRFFVDQDEIDKLEQHTNIIPVDSINENRDESLTAMREAMINHENIVGMIVIGGKIASGSTKPGIDEEIEIAKKRGIPVFIIGAAGGRAGEIASQMHLKENIYNNLSNEFNFELMTSPDFSTLANKLMEELKL